MFREKFKIVNISTETARSSLQARNNPIYTYLSAKHGVLFSMLVMISTSIVSMKPQHFSQRKVTTDIRVENKESFWVSSLYLISEVVDTASCTQGSKLLIIPKEQSMCDVQ